MLINKTFTSGEGESLTSINLTFVESTNIQAYPCGSRRSTFISADTNNDGTTATNEGKYIPFDPEARLNTEANNRKHSSLNGYTQTYLKDWDEANKTLTLSLAGHLFTIKLAKYDASGNVITDSDCTDKAEFASRVDGNIVGGVDTKTRVYANVLLSIFSSNLLTLSVKSSINFYNSAIFFSYASIVTYDSNICSIVSIASLVAYDDRVVDKFSRSTYSLKLFSNSVEVI
jgi:hypothetical protein